jgi:hypothetical protein
MQGEYYSAGGVLDGACVILEEDGIFRSFWSIRCGKLVN